MKGYDWKHEEIFVADIEGSGLIWLAGLAERNIGLKTV